MLSSFFSPILNKRSDRFGGDTARRAELPLARQFRTALAMPLMLLGGINRLDTVEDALDEGSKLVAMSRALIRDPYLVKRFRGGWLQKGCAPTA